MTLYHLNDHSLLKISGIDAQKFLQGQLTCDVTQLNGCAQLGAHCDRKGRVQSLFYIFTTEEAFYLILPNSILEHTMTILKKYAVFFKVQLEEQTTPCYAGSPNITLDKMIEIPIAHHNMSFFINATDALIAEKTLSSETWHHTELQRSVPRLYPSSVGKFLPHELNLPNLHAVSFTKGCYTGQEIVARMEYRGTLKHKLILQTLITDDELVAGNLLTDQTGTLVDWVHDDHKKIIALVLTKGAS